MIKETDEYKRAMEEERASRQQQLHIQAEEAQRLRKRRRDERYFVGLAEKAKAMHGRSERDPKEGLSNTLSSRCIIAEEAKRRHRRKRDERNLVDMQRRQKQGVEEVRKTQKKVQIKY
nr:hypothetical protein CFP56_75005 [Quercus suber]